MAKALPKFSGYKVKILRILIHLNKEPVGRNYTLKRLAPLLTFEIISSLEALMLNSMIPQLMNSLSLLTGLSSYVGELVDAFICAIFLEIVDLYLNVIVYYPVYLNTELDSANRTHLSQ